MKTHLMMDAINYFNANITVSEYDHIYKRGSSYITLVGRKYGLCDKNYELVCSVDEINELILELSNWKSTLKPVNDASVNPSDDKPIFTQAMADKGERVKVGMLFATAAGNQEALMVSDKSVVFEVDGYLYVEIHEFIRPIDTLTPKQKAVDEMYKLWHECDTGDIKDSFNAVYDAGYRKC